MSELSIKKKILISFAAVFVGFVLLFGTFITVSNNLEKIIYDERPVGNAIFPCEQNYTENIFSDQEYMQKDRLVCYTDARTGMTLSIDDENYSSYSDLVVFMYEYIRAVIYGDEVFVNSCYSQKYIEAETGKTYPHYPFTMQKLYDIEFGVMSENNASTEGAVSKVWLDYKIFKNNVSFRTDIGSDVCRRQYLTLVKENDNYKILSVSYIKVEPRKELNIFKTVLLIIGLLLVTFISVAGPVFIIKKMKKKENVFSSSEKAGEAPPQIDEKAHENDKKEE